jgi:ATP-dependent DNA helicase RecG
MKYTEAELESLLKDVESDLAERKESWKGDAGDKGRQAVCAFANDLPDHRRPGVLFVGVNDDGVPNGLSITDELLRTLADIKTDGNILPPPTLTVEKRLLKGHDVAVVAVHPADAPPVRYKGRIWIRTGPRRGLATSQDERILNEKRKFRDLPFDVQPLPSSTLKNIDRLLFEQEYLPNAFAPDVLENNERDYEQRLAACRMIVSADSPIPTVLGIVVLGRNPTEWLPGACIQFLRIDGTQWSDDVADEELIDGPLAQMLHRIDDKLAAHNRISVNYKSQSIERRISLYPQVALQQLVRNAVMHRVYEGTNSPVRVYWFDDRIEIINPGGPFGIVTAANFGKPGYTDYRNPNLADAMRVLGFVQRFGVGIQTAQAALNKNGNPPAEFTVEQEAILCTLRTVS